ncbi:glutathione S-transferase family protein [Vibrio fluvialis]|uniref:glutathione S-transferase family protein n=1 Tax=Vibrio TaxID=662 RepID=UPI00096B92BF|nr:MULTISPECIES: glutathione S-transferase family protein [Vibrio]EKO3390254.1 glutathione S-transferase family protein [Vibrio fluvialis]EKO3398495.1 glutathione S-transferase family protein [Vibrio fluvialis]EKO3471797.1 glutathione S-transferase family protein [Vibrio fluvialis]ELE5891795.1 glutathione S-transferase family protein [Vibrio fluvialis]ELG2041828.1 glutathione S-transferase family protein [Vibrio fluvialis]
MKLYGRATSFNVQKVIWLLEELELSYEHIELGGRFGGLDSADFAHLNPMQKVPVLIDEEKIIWESHTILRYLAANYGESAWYLPDPYQRSLYERWMDWAHLTFQPAFMGTFWGYFRMPEAKRDLPKIMQDLQSCQCCLEQVERQLEGKAYLISETISLADICVGAILYRLTAQGLDITLPANVARWFELLKSRPGYQKGIMSDFSELKGREDF